MIAMQSGTHCMGWRFEKISLISPTYWLQLCDASEIRKCFEIFEK